MDKAFIVTVIGGGPSWSRVVVYANSAHAAEWKAYNDAQDAGFPFRISAFKAVRAPHLDGMRKARRNG